MWSTPSRAPWVPAATRSMSTCPAIAAWRRPRTPRPCAPGAHRAATRRPVGADAFERLPVTLLSGPGNGYRLRLVEHDPSFARAGLYGDDSGDYPDNGARFTLLGRAALEAMRAEARPVDVLHGHDWQAGRASCHCAVDTPMIRCWPGS